MDPRRYSRRLRTAVRSPEVRHFLDVLLEPLDRAARVANGKSMLPPLALRRHAGAPGAFETSASSIIGFIAGTCGLNPTDRVLDVGCGPGAIALQLLGHLRGSGSYDGIDVHAPSIAWARRNITRRESRFRFHPIDLRNEQYNPGGSGDASSTTFPVAASSFDLAIAKSLLTHLRPAETENYIREIGRTLVPGGHALLTFFLLSPNADPARRQLDFPHGDGVWRYHDAALPERAIAFDEGYITDTLRRNRLEAVRPPLYAYQDVLLVRRMAETSS